MPLKGCVNLNEIKNTIAILTVALSTTLNGWDRGIKVLAILMILDVITGLIKAFCMSTLNSTIGRKGISRKLMIPVIVAVAHVLDLILNMEGHLFRTMATLFYIAVEGISILENAGQMGLPLPKGIRGRLEQLKDEMKEGK